MNNKSQNHGSSRRSFSADILTGSVGQIHCNAAMEMCLSMTQPAIQTKTFGCVNHADQLQVNRQGDLYESRGDIQRPIVGFKTIGLSKRMPF